MSMGIDSGPRAEAGKLGYRIRYVEHKRISKEIACYNVTYKGKQIAPKVALEKLHIPMNEIWISKKYKKHEGIILFHELKEIRFRRRGFSERRAHQMAKKAERSFMPD